MYSHTIGYDATFALNEFNEPKITSEAETLKNVLMFILFSKPGSYPSLPQIGMDIGDRLYSFYDEIDENALKTEIIEQCGIMGSYFSGGNIVIKKLIYRKQPSLIIHIEAKSTYPPSYKHDNINSEEEFNIGITYDDMKNLLVNINGK